MMPNSRREVLSGKPCFIVRLRVHHFAPKPSMVKGGDSLLCGCLVLELHEYLDMPCCPFFQRSDDHLGYRAELDAFLCDLLLQLLINIVGIDHVFQEEDLVSVVLMFEENTIMVLCFLKFCNVFLM